MCWPADSRPVYETLLTPKTSATFDELNSAGPRQPAAPKTPDEVRITHLSMVPVAGKYIARRSPSADALIAFLGGQPATSSHEHDRLLRLASLAHSLAHPEDLWLAEPIDAFLDVVRETI